MPRQRHDREGVNSGTPNGSWWRHQLLLVRGVRCGRVVSVHPQHERLYRQDQARLLRHGLEEGRAVPGQRAGVLRMSPGIRPVRPSLDGQHVGERHWSGFPCRSSLHGVLGPSAEGRVIRRRYLSGNGLAANAIPVAIQPSRVRGQHGEVALVGDRARLRGEAQAGYRCALGVRRIAAGPRRHGYGRRRDRRQRCDLRGDERDQVSAPTSARASRGNRRRRRRHAHRIGGRIRQRSRRCPRRRRRRCRPGRFVPYGDSSSASSSPSPSVSGSSASVP